MRKFRTKQARNRERIRLTIRWAVFLLCIAILLGLFAYIAHRPEFRIQKVYVTSDASLNTEVVVEQVETEMTGNFFSLFPRDSVFFLNTDKIREFLTYAYPRAKSIAVRRASLQELSVTIQEREPVALWCGDVVPPIANDYSKSREVVSEEMWGTCYLVDGDAFIYAKAPVYTGDVFPRYYSSLELAEPIGQNFVQQTEFAEWQDFFARFEGDGRTLRAVLFVDERDMELYLSGALRVLVARTDDIEVTERHLVAALSSGVIDASKVVEYLDLRFGSKGFVRYLGDGPQ